MAKLQSNPSIAIERKLQAGFSRLPACVSRWFGYREAEQHPYPSWVVCLWGFLASFGTIALLGFLMGLLGGHQMRYASIPTALAGSAILCFGSIDSPFAQPRALIFGHVLSAIVGMVLYEILRATDDGWKWHTGTFWIIPGLAVAVSLVVMHATGTMHPPAGVSAVLPLTNMRTRQLGWRYLALMLLSSAVVLVIALLINNIQRQYPLYWLAPIPPTETVLSNQHRHRTPPRATPEEMQSEPRRHHDLHDLESRR